MGVCGVVTGTPWQGSWLHGLAIFLSGPLVALRWVAARAESLVGKDPNARATPRRAEKAEFRVKVAGRYGAPTMGEVVAKEGRTIVGRGPAHQEGQGHRHAQ